MSALPPYISLSPLLPLQRSALLSCPVQQGLPTHLLLLLKPATPCQVLPPLRMAQNQLLKGTAFSHLLKPATPCQVLPPLRMAQSQLLKGAAFSQLQLNGMKVSALSNLRQHIHFIRWE